MGSRASQVGITGPSCGISGANARLCRCTCSPHLMAAVARPIGRPNLRTALPGASARSASLCPAGIGSRAAMPSIPLGAPVPRSMRATATSSVGSSRIATGRFAAIKPTLLRSPAESSGEAIYHVNILRDDFDFFLEERRADTMQRDPHGEARQIGFLLLPEFPLYALVPAIEALRLANQNRGRRLYDWRLISVDGAPVPAGSAMLMPVHGSLSQVGLLPTLVVVAGNHPLRHITRPVLNWLRRLDRHGALLGAIDTGLFALAEPGLIGRRN